jgi:3-oxoadipate enol-lactonase
LPSLCRYDLARPDTITQYWTSGPADAPPIVLLHGATHDHRAWQPQIEALQDRFHLVVPDLRGHGKSDARFEFAAAVADVVAMLDELRLGPVVLVGLSLGGNIAQEVIRLRPRAAHAVVLADTTCNTLIRHPLAAEMSIAAVKFHAIMAGRDFARQAARATATSPHAQRYIVDVNQHRSVQEIVDILTALLATAPRPDAAYRLPIPALLVHGEFDRMGDIAAEMSAWARREPLAHYVVIPGAGHVSNLDNPHAFTASLTTFLADFCEDDTKCVTQPDGRCPRHYASADERD